MAAKQSKGNGALVLGGMHTLKITHIEGRKEEIVDGVIHVRKEGTKHTVELDHREAETEEHVGYLSKSTALAKKVETEEGMRALLNHRIVYAMKVFRGQRGLAWADETLSDDDGMMKYGSKFLSLLAQHVFESRGAAEVAIDDPVKSEETSETSSTVVSVQ